MSESEDRIIEILRILNEQKKPTGSKIIAKELKNKGFNLGERAVRYHMQILDEKGYTERMGYSGRQITDLGRKKLEKGVIYDQVDFIFSKFEEMIYLTDFDYNTKKGNVVINTSTIYGDESFECIKKVFESDLAVSPFVNIEKHSNRKEYDIKTICGTTIDGILLNEGIPSIPLYGGLLKIEDYIPTKFTELISYKKTSVSPLDAFIAPKMTSVLDVIEEGNGVIPANFRVIPSACKEKSLDIFEKLKKIGIRGVIGVGEEGTNMLGIPVTEGMVGIAVTGGVTPFCAALEKEYDIDIKIAEEIENFNNLKPLKIESKNILKPADTKEHSQIPFLLSQSWNKIVKVDFDVETWKGNIIGNISYIDKKNLDDALEIMNDTFKSNSKYINPYYKIVDHPRDSNRVGIATICSLSIDGILINNGIRCHPRYGGLLELSTSPLFVDLISYNGSSIDPHKIFISKNMTSFDNDVEPNRILASLKEIPYMARDYSVYLLDILKNIGFSIYKIGKPRELTYNAKVNNYNFGIVTGSGLNLAGALKEKGIDINVKAMDKLMPFEEMERL